jgi:putative SOS response-associated peptidase YedK
MCNSAEVEQGWLKFRSVTGADIGIHEFFRTYMKRQRGLPFRMPKMLDRWFDDESGGQAEAIRVLIAEWNAAQEMHFEMDVFANRKRVADAQRSLQSNVTKKARADVHIGNSKLKQSVRKLDDLKRTDIQPADGRFFPGWYAPVVIVEQGERVVKPMRYQCRPEGKPACYDTKYPGTHIARRDNLEGYWKGQFGHTHGLIMVRKFYENVERDGKNAVLEFTPNSTEDMIVACLYSYWTGKDGEYLWSFAVIEDEPPAEVAATGHDRCIIPIKPEHIEAWLNPDPADLDAQYAILDDRERPYYVHRLAA